MTSGDNYLNDLAENYLTKFRAVYTVKVNREQKSSQSFYTGPTQKKRNHKSSGFHRPHSPLYDVPVFFFSEKFPRFCANNISGSLRSRGNRGEQLLHLLATPLMTVGRRPRPCVAYVSHRGTVTTVRLVRH